MNDDVDRGGGGPSPVAHYAFDGREELDMCATDYSGTTSVNGR